MVVNPSTVPSIREYYDALAPAYDRDRFANSYGRYVDGQERAILSSWLRGRAVDSVVELACGTGRFLDFAGTGVDLSPAMLEEARGKWPGRRLVQADAADTGLLSGGFDAAICFHLLMHLDESTCRAVLAEAARLVRPGGSLIFDIPSRPRRCLTKRPPSGWHGDTSASIDDVRRWAGGAWRLERWRGIVTLPIHRVPSRWRAPLVGVDALVGRTPLGRWSSYYVVEMERSR
ncbi:MAG TPA: class I SAM-dependent methyltransferase [Longimicrobium sp.]|nr:class I SAM-dependent methyltransferase [Longimicrobium sp.]